MLDLGASINAMPTSIYKALNFGDLEPTGMTIQLANRSVVQPLGILEDVLVQVNELIFPTDFYVLDMEDETSRQGSTLILRRPMMSHKMYILSGPKKSAIEQLTNLKDDSNYLFIASPAKLNPPLEAQAESLSARPRLSPCKPPVQTR
ncbi:hypothetical protein CR513_41358, partial [Mucuna pruriens]